MVRTISVDDTDLRTLFDTDEPVIVEDHGQPRLVVMSPDEYERLRGDRIETNWKLVQRVHERNADTDLDEIMRDVDQAVEEVRQQYRDRSQQSAKGCR